MYPLDRSDIGICFTVDGFGVLLQTIFVYMG